MSKRLAGLMGTTLFLLTPARLESQPVPAIPNKIYAVVIGVDQFADAGVQWLKFAHRDAELFDQQLKGRGAQIPALETIVLLNKNATRTKILAALDAVQRRAGPDHEVRIFISSTGRATPLSQEGFIGTYESHGEKPQTAIRVSELRKFLLNCRAGRVLLFADVSREQPVIGMDNRINLALRDLQRSKSELTGVLSTEPSTASFESKDLEGGHGLFGYFLVRALQGGSGQYPYPLSARPAAGRVGLDRVFEYLQQYVPTTSRQLGSRPQKPMPIGKGKPVIYVSSERSGRGDGLHSSAGKFPMLLAQAGPPQPGALTSAPAPALSSETQAFIAELGDAIASGNLLQRGGAAEIFERLRSRIRVITGAADQHALSVALEDAGQHIVAQYGTGDQFPEDPRRLTAAHFRLGEQLFQDARSLREQARGAAAEIPLCGGSIRIHDTEELRSLEARRQFCKGRALLADKMKRTGVIPAVLDEAAVSTACAIELLPDFPEPKNALGIVKLLRADFDGAIAEFLAAKTLAPDWAYPRHNLALAYIEKGLAGEAEREYREAIARTPYYPYLYYNLGLLLQRQNKRKPAREAYVTSIQTFEQQIARYLSRSDQLRNEGETTLATFNQQIGDALVLNEAEAENTLGTIEEDRNKADLAEAQFRAALRLNPNLLPARHNLGLLYSRNGNPTAAKAAWAENERRDQQFHPSRLKLADVLLSESDFAGATKHYKAVLDANTDNTEARIGLAIALGGAGRISEGLDVLNDATEAQKRDARVAITRGDLHLKLKNTNDACVEFRRGLQLSKNSVLARSGELKALQRKLKACPAQ